MPTLQRKPATANLKLATTLDETTLELECAVRGLEPAEKHFAGCSELMARAASNLQRAQKREMVADLQEDARHGRRE